MSSFLASIITLNSRGARKPFYIFGQPDDVHRMIQNAIAETPFVLDNTVSREARTAKHVMIVNTPEVLLLGSVMLDAHRQQAPVILTALHAPEETYPKDIARDILTYCAVFLCEKDVLVRYN